MIHTIDHKINRVKIWKGKNACDLKFYWSHSYPCWYYLYKGKESDT